MPSRLLREGILSSDRVDKLNAEAEVFYRRLMSKVDDYGLFDARPGVLRSALYPLRLETVTDNNCLQWLTDCINAKLIVLYQVDGKPFLRMLDTKWTARSEPKYPKPTNGCKQLKAPVLLDVVVDVCRCRFIEVVVVDVVVGTSDKPVEAEGALPVEASRPVEKAPNGNGHGKTLDERAAALGLSQEPGEQRSMFQLRVASTEAKAKAQAQGDAG